MGRGQGNPPETGRGGKEKTGTAKKKAATHTEQRRSEGRDREKGRETKGVICKKAGDSRTGRGLVDAGNTREVRRGGDEGDL